ncbi:uncharacterized protein B0H64DRAFT_375411 [Chaetomium fimeti]|uniref:Uncharacterized protein n=1 Tax=Chaetomium fimeti TaxID=1854472 RepID=A0AAE0HE70_9PEZI|nr:hypothetical protein B0H64DRAFT_375411 [Chaetomium fimeti]
MTKSKSQDWQELPAMTTEKRPLRTYSHKAKSNRPVSLLSLPPLKPTPKQFTPTTAGVRLEKFHTGNATVYRDDLGQGGVDDDVDELALESLGEASRLEYADHITSPLSPTPNTQVSLHSKHPGPVDEDEDDPFVLSQRPPGCNPKHDRRTGNGMRSLRRRPHLIFSKTEAKGYKQLNLNDEPDAAKPVPIPRFKYGFGDGFSGREAKPNGSNLLTRSGKQAITSPHVGILDLTQSTTQAPGRKRKTQIADIDDNSFVLAPKKKSRGPLQPKDPNRQAKPSPVIPAKVKRTTSARHESGKAREELSAPGAQPRQPKADGHIKKTQAQPIAAKDTGKDTLDNDDEVNLLIIPDIYNAQEFVTVVEEHSFETDVSKPPPRPLLVAAASEDGHMKHTQVQATTQRDTIDDDEEGGEKWDVTGALPPSGREFRRADTL